MEQHTAITDYPLDLPFKPVTPQGTGKCLERLFLFIQGINRRMRHLMSARYGQHPKPKGVTSFRDMALYGLVVARTGLTFAPILREPTERDLGGVCQYLQSLFQASLMDPAKLSSN